MGFLSETMSRNIPEGCVRQVVRGYQQFDADQTATRAEYFCCKQCFTLCFLSESLLNSDLRQTRNLSVSILSVKVCFFPSPSLFYFFSRFHFLLSFSPFPTRLTFLLACLHQTVTQLIVFYPFTNILRYFWAQHFIPKCQKIHIHSQKAFRKCGNWWNVKQGNCKMLESVQSTSWKNKAKTDRNIDAPGHVHSHEQI